MSFAIETRGLTKVFKKGWGYADLFRRRNGRDVRALDGIDLTVKSGEIFALLGPNGAGKTTLIKILCSLVLPDAGEIKIAGMDLLKFGKQIQPMLSLLVGEERSFYWRLTGRQNLEFFASLHGLSKRTAREKIGETAEMFRIEDLDKRYQEYSTGTKHRLALARSFLCNATIIFMDEPTRSLDPNAAEGLRRVIRESLRQHREKTFFFTTHQTHEAQAIADRIAILEKGRFKGCGTLEDLRKQTGNPRADLEEIFHKLTEGSRC